MSIVTTNRPIDLGQLDGEVQRAAALDAPPGLSAATEGTETLVRCDHPAVTQTILDDAIDVHVPADPAPSADAVLQRQINELTDMILFGGF